MKEKGLCLSLRQKFTYNSNNLKDRSSVRVVLNNLENVFYFPLQITRTPDSLKQLLCSHLAVVCLTEVQHSQEHQMPSGALNLHVVKHQHYHSSQPQISP